MTTTVMFRKKRIRNARRTLGRRDPVLEPRSIHEWQTAAFIKILTVISQATVSKTLPKWAELQLSCPTSPTNNPETWSDMISESGWIDQLREWRDRGIVIKLERYADRYLATVSTRSMSFDVFAVDIHEAKIKGLMLAAYVDPTEPRKDDKLSLEAFAGLCSALDEADAYRALDICSSMPPHVGGGSDLRTHLGAPQELKTAFREVWRSLNEQPFNRDRCVLALNLCGLIREHTLATLHPSWQQMSEFIDWEVAANHLHSGNGGHVDPSPFDGSLGDDQDARVRLLNLLYCQYVSGENLLWICSRERSQLTSEAIENSEFMLKVLKAL